LGRLSARRWDIDAARGFAVVAMVAYHFSWDLDRFGFIDADFIHGPWQWAGRAIGASFLLLMGVSLVLHRDRALTATGRPPPFAHYARRAALLLAAGVAITVATRVFVGAGFVMFGILHLLGVATLLALPFIRNKAWPQFRDATVFLVGGLWLSTWPALPRAPFAWLGAPTQGPSMVDWYPIFPWFGFVLIGTGIATLAIRRKWSLPEPRFAASPPARAIAFLGRHSLVIYLAHQPLLLGAFHLLGYAGPS
jgi:uncharacterized membrane protein